MYLVIFLVVSLLVLMAGYGIWLYQFLTIAYLFTFYLSLLVIFASMSTCASTKKHSNLAIWFPARTYWTVWSNTLHLHWLTQLYMAQTLDTHLSRFMTKHSKMARAPSESESSLSAWRKLGSLATKTNKSLGILDIESRCIILSKQRTTKALIRLRACAVWSAPFVFRIWQNQVFSWRGSSRLNDTKESRVSAELPSGTAVILGSQWSHCVDYSNCLCSSDFCLSLKFYSLFMIAGWTSAGI